MWWSSNSITVNCQHGLSQLSIRQLATYMQFESPNNIEKSFCSLPTRNSHHPYLQSEEMRNEKKNGGEEREETKMKICNDKTTQAFCMMYIYSVDFETNLLKVCLASGHDEIFQSSVQRLQDGGVEALMNMRVMKHSSPIQSTTLSFYHWSELVIWIWQKVCGPNNLEERVRVPLNNFSNHWETCHWFVGWFLNYFRDIQSVMYSSSIGWNQYVVSMQNSASMEKCKMV